MHMRKLSAALLVLISIFWISSAILAVPLDTYTTYVTAHPAEAKKGIFAELLARGTGTNDMYVLEVDPTTGAIPISGAGITLGYDENYGTVGATTLRTAAQIGNATGAAAFGTGTRSAQTLRVTVATDDNPATSTLQTTGNTSLSSIDGKVANNYGVATGAIRTADQIGNASGAADFGTGAAGAQTLRTVISSRSESVTTPLAAQLSNGSAAVDYNSGAAASTTLRTVLATRHESVATPLAAQLSNGTSAIDYGSGAAGTATVRVVPSTRSESVTTPLAAQLSNGSAAIAYGTGADGSTVIRVTPSTRSETASTPLAVRISDGSSFSSPSPAGRSYADSARNDYTSTSVTTGAWVQLIASTAAVINQLYLFDSSGQTLELGTGAGGAETRKLIIPPGGIDGPVNIAIPAGTRIAVRAVSATASVGELDITGYQ